MNWIELDYFLRFYCVLGFLFVSAVACGRHRSLANPKKARAGKARSNTTQYKGFYKEKG